MPIINNVWRAHIPRQREIHPGIVMILQKKSAFTLVEIMIVVAIIGLLAAIAIPNLLRSRVNSNESTAKGALRTLGSALESYRTAQVEPLYPTALSDLNTSSPNYADEVLSSGTKNGYVFTYARTSILSYTISATPQISNVTGSSNFYLDEKGTIRYDNATGEPIS